MTDKETDYAKNVCDYALGKQKELIHDELSLLLKKVDIFNSYGKKFEDQMCRMVEKNSVNLPEEPKWKVNMKKDLTEIYHILIPDDLYYANNEDLLDVMKTLTIKKASSKSTTYRKRKPEDLLQTVCETLKPKIIKRKNIHIALESRESDAENEVSTNQLVTENKIIQNNESYQNNEGCSIEHFCELYKKEIDREMRHLQNHGGKRYRLMDGMKIYKKYERYIYTFESDDELHFPDSAELNIYKTMDGKPIAGSVIGCIDFTIILSSSEDLGDTVTTIEISVEPWRLLFRLNSQLDELMLQPSAIVRQLICNGKNQIDYTRHEIVTGQKNAVEMANKQPITFVWGPPGTGKTQTLAQIAIDHIQQGHKVLMISYSNVSVDGAILRTFSLDKSLQPGEIVRYGYARDEVLLNHEYLTSYNLTIRNYPELVKKQNELLAERKKVARSTKRYVEIEEELRKIRKNLSEEEHAVVKKARFVATTVSKAVVDAVIYNNMFDVVIFDEASMAYLPQVIFTASLARKHFVCLGDFRQLPPIVQNAKDSILNTDIFYHCGIVDAVNKGCNHKWLCMLNEQHRMHPQIAAFANHVMYNGLLKSANGMAANRENISADMPIANNAIAFVDLSGMMSVCTKTLDESRINVLSAFISIGLASIAAQNHDVGIITPYHAQSRLLHAMALDIAENNTDLCPITCATVHQFQGSEKDIILYDAVDCYRMSYPGMLITSTNNDYANRLFNVAITRAKGKFVGIANVDYLERKKLSKKLMFTQLINDKKNSSGYRLWDEILPELSMQSNKTISFYEKNDGSHEFIADLQRAKKEVRFDIPDKALNNKHIGEIVKVLSAAKKNGVKIYIRAEVKNNLPLVLQPYAVENPYIANPVSIIDKKIVWFGMPRSNADFITEDGKISTLFRPIIRFVGKKTAIALYAFLEMNQTEDKRLELVADRKGQFRIDNFSEYILATKTCSKCGKPLKLKKGQKGKFFIACTNYPNCKHTELVTVDLVNEYLTRKDERWMQCKQCTYSLEAKIGQYGVYVECGNLPPHRFKLDEI